jgi:quinohemoprotein ethanol dehydrogenase
MNGAAMGWRSTSRSDIVRVKMSPSKSVNLYSLTRSQSEVGRISQRLLLVLMGVCAWLATTPARAGALVDGRAIADEKQGVNWLSVGRTYSEQHYSPLTGINAGNVAQLGLAWYLDLPGERALEATPLAVDGVLYFSGAHGKTYAVDARSGRQLWQFDPDSGQYRPKIFRLSASAGGHRGVAYWQGKVYVVVIDGRLFALDAKSGKPAWSVQTFDIPKATNASSGAPRIFNGKVIIGNGGDMSAPVRGYVTAYDAQTGRRLWRFFTVPGDPRAGFESPALQMAAKTWDGQWWQQGGGGNVWDAITYDPQLNRVYLGVGCGFPHSASERSPGHGDNLFTCAIVALDADTGAYVWHYQMNPRDSLDYDSSQQMVLADLMIDASVRHVLMQAQKNGFFYVIDRADGKLISAEKFSKVTWAERIDLKTGRPVETANIRFENGPVAVWPSDYGAHNWQAMAFSPRTGLVYIPAMKAGMRIGPNENERIRIDPDDGTASLLAWDPVAQKKRWEVHYPDCFWNGGTLATAGDLVFQGTARGQFIAYHAVSGQKLWSFAAGLGIIAAPITYEVDGTQYVSILVGYGGAPNFASKLFDGGWRFNEQPRRLLTFALGKRAALPPGGPPRYRVNAVDDPTLVIDAKQAARGLELVEMHCSYCHGDELKNTGSFAPDLRESPLAVNWEAFKSVLHDGSRAPLGMPKFDDLNDGELRAIYMYIRQRAREASSSQ